MTDRKTYVEVIKSWLGKNEADGTHKAIIDIYNSYKPHPRGYKVKYTDSWCAATVSAAAIKSGNTDIIPIECSCGKMIALAQSKGIWVENDAYVPAAGDIIMYDWDDNGKGNDTGWPEHVGVVEVVNGSTITVIEGNLSNKVGRRNIGVNAKYIRGYIVPKFSAGTTPTTTPTTNTTQAAPAVVYFPKYKGTSNKIDTVFKAINVPSNLRGSWKKRKPVAEANGIKNYTGTASQNLSLIALAKQGKLIKP